MRALVLGAGGQVGRALTRASPPGVSVTSMERAECDVTDRDWLRAVVADVRPDLLFNAAGYTAVDRAEAEPEKAHLLNGKAPGWMAAAARDTGARFVHISTDFVFDGTAPTPRGPGDATNPRGVYARSKLEGECSVRGVDPGNLVVRAAWVYAPSGVNFVNTMLGLMRERDTINVVADQVGTPTRAACLASALWALAAAGARGIHHFTDAGVASWYDFAVAIQEEARAIGLIDRAVRVVPIASVDYPTAAPRPAYSVLDKSVTWALLGGPAPHWRASLRANLLELKNG